ncbi:hypothetical protein MIB92_18875 [Aestuariirhabdus sp. Z084]|uniref:hypothetical protein n=1 Tax=Aestuariirhabdus haliotis TaxID=2918751 RepID=UPI00201B39A5|nr:hypothetical protein [Aestuariirhabdus haliotis]MCL6417731.1 hypothetical protein [Aestuariirhabdus haliotis]MCL6421664.1 hypothetical protein [Aestuariirhabdus haliotis]
MKKFLIFIAIAIPFFGLSIAMSIYQYNEPERQRFDGTVSLIDWKSSNHGMPLIEIKRNNGTTQRFHSTRILLNADHLKVGDQIIKESGSLNCLINETEVACVK